MCVNKTTDTGKILGELHKKSASVSNHLRGDLKTSGQPTPKDASAFTTITTLSSKSEICDLQKDDQKEDSSAAEDPIRQLLYSTSKTSALSSSGSSTSSNSSGVDKQDLSLDPHCEQINSENIERHDVTGADSIAALSLPQRDLDVRDTHQQGEDSGIESMDTLSEKSPNQGEDSFPNQEKLDRELKDVTPLTIPSPSHNQLSATSSSKVNTKMPQISQNKLVTIDKSNINDTNPRKQPETSSMIAHTKVIPEALTEINGAAIGSTVKTEPVHLSPKAIEDTNTTENGANVKTPLQVNIFSENMVKKEDLDKSEIVSTHSLYSKDNANESTAKTETESPCNNTIEEDKRSSKSNDGSSSTSEEFKSILDTNDRTKLDSNMKGDGISTTSEMSGDSKTKTETSDIETDQVETPSNSGHEVKEELLCPKNMDKKVEGESVDDLAQLSNKVSSCLTPVIPIEKQQEPSVSDSSVNSESKKSSLTPSSQVLSVKSSNEHKSNEGETKETVTSSKYSALSVEKITATAKSIDVTNSDNTTKLNGPKEVVEGSNNHASVSVSLLRLPAASETINGSNDYKKGSDQRSKGLVSDAKFASLSDSAETDVSKNSSTVSVKQISIPCGNGINIASNGTTMSSNQEDHERSSSSTPEIPMLTGATEIVNPTTVTNCITLHSAASAIGRTSSPILTNGTTGGGIQVHRAAGLNNIPPGAKMVPVKLVSVPGVDGNMPGMRLVRVSPVKTHPAIHQGHPGGITIDANTLGSVPRTRTVVIKSSMLKSATTGAMAQAATVHQNATIISTTASYSAFPSTSIMNTHPGSSVIAGPSAFAITPNPSPLPPHIVTSQPLSPSLLLNASQNPIHATPPPSVLKEANANTSTPPATPPINNASELMGNAGFSIPNHNNSSTMVELIPNSTLPGLNHSVHSANLPISVSIARRSISASVVPVPAMNTISSAAASSSGVTTLLGPSLSITPVEVGGGNTSSLSSSGTKSIIEHGKPPSSILNSVLASMAATAPRNSEPSPMIVTSVSRNHMSGTTIVDTPILVKSPTDISRIVQAPAAVTVSLKPKLTEALKIDTKVKGLNIRNRATKSPQRHHSNGDDFGGGGSLLRPLLQKEETLPATFVTTNMEMGTSAASASMASNASSTALQKGKRRRRHDTGSSTKSDKSDNSLADPSTSSAKKSKIVTSDSKKGQQQNNLPSNVSISTSSSVSVQKNNGKGARRKYFPHT